MGEGYYGLDVASYNALSQYETFQSILSTYFTKTVVDSKGNIIYYLFSGGEEEFDDFNDLLIDNDLDEVYGLEYFLYLKSTWGVNGF